MTSLGPALQNQKDVNVSEYVIKTNCEFRLILHAICSDEPFITEKMMIRGHMIEKHGGAIRKGIRSYLFVTFSISSRVKQGSRATDIASAKNHFMLELGSGFESEICSKTDLHTVVICLNPFITFPSDFKINLLLLT
jgi:hypothetical protein